MEQHKHKLPSEDTGLIQQPNSQVPPQSYYPPPVQPQVYYPQPTQPQAYYPPNVGQAYPQYPDPQYPSHQHPYPPQPQINYDSKSQPYPPQKSDFPPPSNSYNNQNNGPIKSHTNAYDAVPYATSGIKNSLTAQDEPFTLDNMNTELRNGFIRKVYSILSLQLILTLIIGGIFVTDAGRNFIVSNSWLLILAMVVYFVSAFTLICCEKVAKTSPTNYILLTIFTIAMSIMIGTTCGFFPGYIVLQALIATFVIFGALTIYAFVTKSDFTGYGLYLFIALIALMVFGLFAFIFPTKLIYTFYCAAGALLFCCYIVYDTQRLMIGLKNRTLQPDEYIYAALSLYLDIINLFLYLLRILAALNSNR